MLRLCRPWALAVAVACIVPTAFVAGEPTAEASTAIALSFDDLVTMSDVVVVATAKSRTARWEGGRIVSYTTAIVDESVGAGPKVGDAVVVRTLGGVVGDVGQKVFGEAVLPIGKQAVLFLRTLPPAIAASAEPTSKSVTGMEQGVMHVALGTDKVARIAESALTLNLVPPVSPKGVPAHVAAAGRPVKDVLVELRTLWTTHGKK